MQNSKKRVTRWTCNQIRLNLLIYIEIYSINNKDTKELMRKSEGTSLKKPDRERNEI